MKFRSLFASAAGLLLLAGCSQHQQRSSTPAPAPSAVADAHAKLSIPEHVKHLTNVPFTLSLTDKTGKPITGMRATVGLEMPSMTMPPNVVRLTSDRPGIYTGAGVFTMAGTWQATAVYLDGSGNEGSSSIPVQVK